MAARVTQSVATLPTPTLRSLAEAALAMARVIERKEPDRQVKQAIPAFIGRFSERVEWTVQTLVLEDRSAGVACDWKLKSHKIGGYLRKNC